MIGRDGVFVCCIMLGYWFNYGVKFGIKFIGLKGGSSMGSEGNRFSDIMIRDGANDVTWILY